PPLHESFIQIHQTLAQLAQNGISAIDLDQNRPERGGRLDWPGDIPLQIGRRHRDAVGRQIVKKGVPERFASQPPFQAQTCLAPRWVAIERLGVFAAEDELELAELVRLESTPGLKPV